jgi:hypothetical protein
MTAVALGKARSAVIDRRYSLASFVDREEE